MLSPNTFLSNATIAPYNWHAMSFSCSHAAVFKQKTPIPPLLIGKRNQQFRLYLLLSFWFGCAFILPVYHSSACSSSGLKQMFHYARANPPGEMSEMCWQGYPNLLRWHTMVKKSELLQLSHSPTFGVERHPEVFQGGRVNPVWISHQIVSAIMSFIAPHVIKDVVYIV